ncbi:1,4-dihydroxy-2-naphthoate octaprenyltransferase [Tepidiforma sp.]|uniref:1,4-dihydroxy-2-naphthoate octaprenyltransferase n=1 Tax=Tepidiforma sp. TaxID=2682230 RepID=UPI002ADDD8EE|nr:1,4-dihydroxy-2-naphthoate octaprenyltransferase [Tepidiforma sp.]
MPALRTWFAASRPVSFTAAAFPALVGTLLAAPERFTWWTGLLAIAGSVLFLAGTNFVNDYYDHRKGSDGPGSLGPPGAIQRGLLSPRQVLTAGIACFAAGAGAGLILCAVVSWQLLWVGVAGLLAGFLYTGWPLHLAYRALGEVVVFAFMGPAIVMGAAFVQIERWTWEAFVASLPVGLLAAAILQANNLRDLDHDRATGKRTLATILGRRAAEGELWLLLGGAYLALVAAVAAGALPWPTLAALATLPLLRPIARTIRAVKAGANPRRLNLVLRDAALLHLRFGLLLALGLAVDWALP